MTDRARPDRRAAAEAVAALLRALGHQVEGELEQTPELVASAWCDELLDGESLDPVALLREAAVDASEAASRGPVVLRDLAVTTICPHHLLPAHGWGDVVYLPGSKLAGLGTIARALRACTRRLVLQETAGASMAESLVEALGARGAICRLRLTHGCLLARGARESSAKVETLSMAGDVAEGGEARQLALAALTGKLGE